MDTDRVEGENVTWIQRSVLYTPLVQDRVEGVPVLQDRVEGVLVVKVVNDHIKLANTALGMNMLSHLRQPFKAGAVALNKHRKRHQADLACGLVHANLHSGGQDMTATTTR